MINPRPIIIKYAEYIGPTVAGSAGPVPLALECIVGCWGSDNVQCHLDRVVGNFAINRKVASSPSVLGYERTRQQVPSRLAIRTTFWHEDARTTRATTNPALPVELVLIKRCVLALEHVNK